MLTINKLSHGFSYNMDIFSSFKDSPYCTLYRAITGTYLTLSLKCKIFTIWLVETACVLMIFLITTVQISIECETQKREAKYTKHLNLY